MSFKNRWTISSSYDFQVHQQRSQRRCCLSQTDLLWFGVLPEMSPALPGLSPALPGSPRLVVGAPRLVAGAPSYSEGRQECLPMVWYSPEIDASKFTLHILPDTPGGFQWLKYILLMNSVFRDKYTSVFAYICLYGQLNVSSYLSANTCMYIDIRRYICQYAYDSQAIQICSRIC